MAKQKPRVAIALSGGVDSAVAAKLLKDRNYDLTALYLKLFAHDKGENQARVIAEFLRIPFYGIDAQVEFEEKIINYFLEEYKEGRTPNPCVKCNRDIKFGMLYKKAIEMGFDKLATGHYISKKQENPAGRQDSNGASNKTIKQVEEEGEQKLEIGNWKLREGGEVECEEKYHLYAAKDKQKDQSYFLYNLTQDVLKNAEFPLGDCNKRDVKKMAEKWKLPIREEESQDICFLVNANQRECESLPAQTGEAARKYDHNEFLKKRLKMKRGDIITLNGKKVGEHEGLPLYTIGQRRAVGIGGTGPYYVVRKDLGMNALIVSEDRDNPLLYSDTLIAGNINWIIGKEPKMPCRIKARIRYRQEAENAVVDSIKYQVSSIKQAEKCGKSDNGIEIKKLRNKGIGDRYTVKFKSPQRAVTPGQSVVFYKGDEVLGGGIISTKNKTKGKK
ncbi:MAG: tRNA 2-thiouridine(34) synthase MnmA [bacterium]